MIYSHSGFMQRLLALLRKETRQLWRDRSNLAVGLLLPVVLILLFGYGLSFDVKKAPIALVMEETSPLARDITQHLYGSSYLNPIWASTMHEAEQQLRRGEVDAIVRIPANFSRQLHIDQAQIQCIINGNNVPTARSIESYITGALGIWIQQQAERSGSKPVASSRIVIEPRMWFNPAAISTWYLIPGLVVLILTLIGAFLTSLLIAREWERGTLESLFVTPVRPIEIVMAKIMPYLLIGIIDIGLCLLAAKFMFAVPIQGSILVIFAISMLYLVVSLLLGLLISGKTRNQFLASQVALLLSFLPALMLSGFVFDLRNVPLGIQVISQIIPATHFISLARTLFLVGNDWPAIIRAILILSSYIFVLGFATQRTLRKTLDGYG